MTLSSLVLAIVHLKASRKRHLSKSNLWYQLLNEAIVASFLINIGVTDLAEGCHTMAEEEECDNIPWLT